MEVLRNAFRSYENGNKLFLDSIEDIYIYLLAEKLLDSEKRLRCLQFVSKELCTLKRARFNHVYAMRLRISSHELRERVVS